jgi:Spy/CpxP family protein refolding chaperone
MNFKSIQHASIVISTITVTTLVPNVILGLPKPLYQTAQQNNTHPSSESSSSNSILRQLNLSQEQRQKIHDILYRRSNQITLVLTPAQRTRLKQELDSGTPLGLALRRLNINTDQKRQAARIIKGTNKEIEAVLSREQRARVRAYLEQHGETDQQDPIE